MADLSLCIVCKSELSSDEKFTQISAEDGSLEVYQRRLETALGLLLTKDVLSDKKLCCRCEERLIKIEELRKVQQSFREDFMGSSDISDVKGLEQEQSLDGDKPSSHPDKYVSESAESDSKPIRQGRRETKTLSIDSDNDDEDSKISSNSSMPKEREKDTETHCDICNTTMSTNRGLKLHMRIHQDFYTDTCKVCGKHFREDALLDKHIKQAHSNLDLLQCSLCDYTANSKNKIRLHALSKHKGQTVEYLNRLDDIPEWPKSKQFITNLQCRGKDPPSKRPRRGGDLNDFRCLKCSSTFEELTLLKQHMAKHRKVIDSPIAEDNALQNDVPLQDAGRENTKQSKKLRILKEEKSKATVRKAKGEGEKIKELHESDVVLSGSSQNHVGDTLEYSRMLAKNEKAQEVTTETENSEIENMNKKSENELPCSACDLSFPDLTSLKNHRKSVHKRHGRAKTISYPCPHCVRVFNHDVDLADHVRDHNEGKILMCAVCQTGFRQQSTLEDHILTHTGAYPFKCHDCGKGFARAWALKNHKTEHTKETPYACKYCSVKFKKIDQRLMHYKRQHPQHSQDRKYECPHCGQCFHTIRNLDVHMRKEHKDEPNQPWQCTLCDMSFPHLLEYRNHCKKQHEEEEKRFSCETCGKTFYRKANMQAHLETHVEEKTCECKICFKMFKGKAQLASHMHWHGSKSKTTKGQTFLCDECGKSYKNLKGLQAHLRCHKGDRTVTCEICKLVLPNPSRLKKHLDTVHASERPYKCDICAKTFVYEISFKSHKNMHLDVRPFLCNICGKGFRTRPHLKEHMNFHNQIKAFVCNQCNMSFMWRAQLLRHKKDFHSDPNAPKQPTVKRGPRKKQHENLKKSSISQTPVVKSSEISTQNEVIMSAETEAGTQELIKLQPVIEREVSQVEPTNNTFVQIKADGQFQGSLLQGQLLQSMPIEAIVEQPGTAGRKTYIIRPSHIGFVAAPEVSHQPNQQMITQQPDNMNVLTMTMQGEAILEPVVSSTETTLQHLPMSVAPSSMQFPIAITQSVQPLNSLTQISNTTSAPSLLPVQTNNPDVSTAIPQSTMSSASTAHPTFAISSSFSGMDSIVPTITTLQPATTDIMQVPTTVAATSSANEGVTEAGIAAAQLQIQYI